MEIIKTKKGMVFMNTNTRATAEMVDVIIERLLDTSKESPVTNKQLCGLVNTMFGVSLTQPEMRTIIHRIRCDHVIHNLLAAGNGYYISHDVAEIMDYINSLQTRIEQIAHIKYAILKQYREMITMKMDFIEGGEDK